MYLMLVALPQAIISSTTFAPSFYPAAIEIGSWAAMTAVAVL